MRTRAVARGILVHPDEKAQAANAGKCARDCGRMDEWIPDLSKRAGGALDPLRPMNESSCFPGNCEAMLSGIQGGTTTPH